MVKRTSKTNLGLIPWWLYFGLAVLAYNIVRFLPTILPSNNATEPFERVAQLLALPVAGLLVIAGIASAVYQLQKRKRRARLLAQSRGIARIRALSWLEFEQLVAAVYSKKGYSVNANDSGGADNGVDIELRRDGLLTLVQCKHWKSNSVGVSTVREHLGIMTVHKASKGIIVCSGRYTKSAIAFAEQANIELIDGEQLSRLVESVQDNGVPSSGEPTYACPKCGKNMIKRFAKTGKHAGTAFLGCSQYPKCKGMLSLDH